MPKKKTHEEYVKQLYEKAPHIIVKELYKGNRVKIEHYCKKHNTIFKVSHFNILQRPTGCKYCQEEILKCHIDKIRKSNDQFLCDVEKLNNGISPDESYLGSRVVISFHCKLNHHFLSTPHDILEGYGCPYCAGNKVLRGYNDLWTTHPDIAYMLANKNIGYEISKGSHREVDWICPNCGTHKISSPKQVIEYGLSCPTCSDGISYPNKFISSLLKQLKINFIREWSPEWIGRYKYDAYFIYKDIEYVVEMDGGIGHGCVSMIKGEQDTEGLMRDAIKDEQAKLHNVVVIRIDCKYMDKQQRYRFAYVKQSILNSQLNKIFDLSNIDWMLCNQESLDSLHIQAATQYENGLSIKEIACNLNVSYSAVYEWLKELSKVGLSSYVPVLGTPLKYRKINK